MDVLSQDITAGCGDLMQGNLPMPQHLFIAFFLRIRTLYGVSGYSCLHGTDGTLHAIESQSGVQHGDILKGERVRKEAPKYACSGFTCSC